VKRLAVACALLVAAGALAVASGGSRSAAPASEPIAFDHKLHIEKEDLECTECHAGAETGVHAGLPDIQECADCHDRAKGDHPDEPKVREFASRDEQIPFVRVERYPGHVYFSHRVHVKLAGLECKQCHGDVASRSQTIDAPVASRATMQECMACHREQHASLECVACHK
jgi:menaquinone reductase, multiheme cytochrome c subunit